MTSWLDTPLEGRELVEYAVSRLPCDWVVRENGTIVGNASGVGERTQKVAPNVKPRRRRKRRRS